METATVESDTVCGSRAGIVRRLEEAHEQLRSVEFGADATHELLRTIADAPDSGHTYTVDGSIMLALVGLMATVSSAAEKASAAVDAASKHTN